MPTLDEWARHLDTIARAVADPHAFSQSIAQMRRECNQRFLRNRRLMNGLKKNSGLWEGEAPAEPRARLG